MNTRDLANLLELVVKKAVREELKSFKTQILTEIRQQQPIQNVPSRQPNQRAGRDLREVQTNFRKNYQVQQPKVQYQDPMLQKMLSSVKPLEESNYLEAFESDDEIVNLPTNDQGQPIKAPDAVIQAMNRNYSHLFEQEQQVSRPVQRSTNSQLKSSIIGKMEALNGNDAGFDDGYEEDFSFLNDLTA